jgi:putative membrane protein
MMHWWSWDGWWFMIIPMIIFWALVITGFILLVRWLASQHNIPTSTTRESSVEILKQRYARGDISREQYLEMLRDIETRENQ